MKINYLILAHKELGQLDRLIQNLEGENTHFFIHIDKKVSLKDIKRLGSYGNPCVTFIKHRKDIAWGGFNMIIATLSLLKAAMASVGKEDSYFILLSGQDFPIKSNQEIQQFLFQNYGKEFITHWQIPHSHWENGGVDRFIYYWFVDEVGMQLSQHLFAFQKANGMVREYYEDFPPFGGSQWWCLTRECVAYILRFIRTNPVILDYFKNTLIPDEMFFQTIVIHSDFRNKVVNDNLRYIVFEKGNSHPNYLLASDCKLLIDSEKLWARKFDHTIDHEIITLLESYRGSECEILATV